MTHTLLPGFGPLFFGIFVGWVRACCPSLCAELVGSLPLVLPGPATDLPGTAMESSSQPALFFQAICQEKKKKKEWNEMNRIKFKVFMKGFTAESESKSKTINISVTGGAQTELHRLHSEVLNHS